ncbi:MAG: hypothetical protein NTV86_03790 [Planctomycetota bacterium]|nr:hypothetical protein [Planctomycetota bacterium]
MTIICARNLSAADLRHLGPNLAAKIWQDWQNACALSAQPARFADDKAEFVSPNANKKELISC